MEQGTRSRCLAVHFSGNMCLTAVFVLACTASLQSDKLDVGLSSAAGEVSVFVRMEDQVFKKGGDFEAFCKANEGRKRSALRIEMLATLKSKAEESWEDIKPIVEALEKSGDIKDVAKFWIVNGFACDATAKACKELAKSEHVSFVYRQSGPPNLKQHRPAPARKDVARENATRAMLARVRADEPFTTDGIEVPWDLRQIQADQVWAKEGVTGQGAVVAINDGGMHDLPCFESAMWRNEKETVNNKDDDGNGYVDDVFGYDFSLHNGHVFGAEGVYHGTMCAGIVAGRPTKEKPFVSGVAPRAKLMLLNGMGYLKTFEYALANGADVVSMSYMWVNMEIGNYRGVFRLAAEHMTAAGVLAVGGAGNFATSAPEGKQITLPKDIPCVMAIAGTQEDGSRPNFSSKGPVTWSGVRFYDDYPDSAPLHKPDVSAPASGFLVWSRNEGLREQWTIAWQGKGSDALVKGPQGNSFAGPHAAGVAALMFSANPEINAWQVKRIIEETSQDMGEPGYDFVHGAGLIQSLAAVRGAKAIKK